YDPTQTLNFTNMALSQNRKPKTELVSAKGMLATKEATKLLNLQPFSDVYRVDRVRYLEDRPVVYVTNYIRPELFPNLLDYDLSKSLTDIYREHFGVVYQKIRYRVSTTSLLGETAQAL
ncbi:UTRA domain-containing protein, partial [Vibrio breoganii]